MIIRQAHISQSVIGFKERIIQKYHWKNYHTNKLPCIFWGCYLKSDVERVLKHKSLGVIVWRGSDICRVDNHFRDKLLKKQKNIKHVAISSFIKNDLNNLGLSFKYIPISVIDTSLFMPTELGDMIYIYAPENKQDIYNMNLTRTIIDQIRNIKFYISNGSDADHKNMHVIYSKCFAGIRLTTHDGLANTVLELGLMGRKCIWNGDCPNSVRWSDIDDIKSFIETEIKKVGTYPDSGVYCGMRDFLKVNRNWIDTDFWK